MTDYFEYKEAEDMFILRYALMEEIRYKTVLII